MFAVLSLAILSITPDVNLELGYGRTANRVGKPSSELLRIRAGVEADGWLNTSIGLSVTVPTTMPTSLGIQVEIEEKHSNLWAQLELGYAARHFMIMGACGWYIFGIEAQARNTDRGSDIAFFGKISFSVMTLYEVFKDKKDEAKRRTAE